MNDGKICVSICAATADELIARIKCCENSADVIEIRFDCLHTSEIPKALALLHSKKSLLLTYRPQAQGGKIALDEMQRKVFWDAFVLNGNFDVRRTWFDFEYDLPKMSPVSDQKTIRSFHAFDEVPAHLDEIYAQLAENSDTVKIAVQTDEIADSIRVWKLLEKAKNDNKQIIPIAMGEAGKWTRILGLAHGAFLTYAASDDEHATAPGQISVKDLTEIYRVKELNAETEIYGILGNPVAQSLSPPMQNAAFKQQQLNAVFVPFEVRNLDKFFEKFVREKTREVELNFCGFSVTAPHKQAIIKHLDEIDETAAAIGAVNTIRIENGKICGYNTDAHGFVEPLKNVFGDLRGAKVAVFGAGGAARACVFALKKEAAKVTIYARDLPKAEILAEEFDAEFEEFSIENRKSKIENTDIIVNATSLGMKNKFEAETPLLAEQFAGVNLVYDLVYNPFQTRLMSEASKIDVPAIGGMAMLVAQGMKQFEIWTGKDAPLKTMSAAVLSKLK